MPTNLDIVTIGVADISLTALLGLMLLFAWLQSRSSLALGWWGTAHLCQSVGLALLAVADSMSSLNLLKTATSLILVSYALMWIGARRFGGHSVRPLLVFGGVLAWMIAAFSGLPSTAAHYFMFYSAINAAYCFAIAFEFWRGRSEQLISRWPAIVLLCLSGAGFLSWIILSAVMPRSSGSLAFPERWFAVVILVTILGKVALAFIVLAMAKERLELRQRNEALTDPLTGLPNRRAFFRQALRRTRPQHGAASPVAVLLFDLDQFKSINDRYGHGYGDQVLVLFAEILSSRLKATDVIGRVGGEEFAVLLPGTDLASAAIAAERVRAAYEDSAAVIDGNAIRATVSVGVAATEAADCSLHELLGHADSALYSAKAAGRNCIRLVDARSKNRTDGPALPGRVAVPA